MLAADERGINLIRFNQDEFPTHIEMQWRSDGEIAFRSGQFNVTASDVSGAWYRRAPYSWSRKHGFVARESAGFLRGLWETADWKWMNRPAAVHRAENKLVQLRNARALGLQVPNTLITNCAESARAFVQRQPSIVKTVVSAGLQIGGSDRVIFTTSIALDQLQMQNELHQCPVIFQAAIAKSYDLRVTLVGDLLFAAAIHVSNRTEDELDWRSIDDGRLTYEIVHLDPDIVFKCRKLSTAFGLSYAAIDFVVSEDGRYFFLELNPSGQWGWLERKLGFAISDAILMYLDA